MTLSAIQQALLTLAAAALEECERVVPDVADRVRYNGEPPVTKCCENGLLTVHWTNAKFDTRGLNPGSGSPPGRPEVDLDLRLYRCWPTIDSSGHFPGCDAAADELAGDFDCLWTAFTVAICDNTLAAHLSGCDELVLTSAQPRSPRGGCAGIQFVFRAGWKPWP